LGLQHILQQDVIKRQGLAGEPFNHSCVGPDVGGVAKAYTFVSLERLLEDFEADVRAARVAM
jgi:hypothetical protein